MLILGSTSPYKRQLLKQLGLKFICADSVVNERAHHQATVAQTVKYLAELKARALLKKYTNTATIIITSDVAGELDGKFLGKPANITDAKNMLLSYSNRTVLIWCGTSIANDATNKIVTHLAKAEIVFLPITEIMVDSYMQKYNTLDKGGALAIEQVEKLGWVKQIIGEYNAIIGLSTEFISHTLSTFTLHT